MPHRPKVVLFDLLETLFSLEPLRDYLTAAGLSRHMLHLWFARTLRDGFALAASNVYRPFKEVASAALLTLANDMNYHPDAEKIEAVMQGFSKLPCHPDVSDGFEMLDSSGVEIATLTNGSADTARTLLESANLMRLVKHVISIDEISAWKPRAEVYWVAADTAGAEPQYTALVAAHPWDCHGAKHAGLITGWIKRSPAFYNTAMTPPDVQGDTLSQVVLKLLEL